MQDRATPGGDGVDVEHGRAHPHAGDLGLEGALIAAGIMRDIGRGAAHVEADNALEAGRARSLHRPDDAARRPERIASLPWKRRASTSPPLDCMNSSRAPPSAAAMRSTWRRRIGER